MRRSRLGLARLMRGGGILAGAPSRIRRTTSASVVLRRTLSESLSAIEGAGALPYYSETPSELVALKPSRATITVYGWLDLRAGRRGYWFTSQAAMAAACGVSVATVERAVRFLRRAGFIETERQHHAGDILKYTVTRPHRRGHLPSQMRAPSLTDDGSNGDLSTYRDHRSQQQIPTRRSSSSGHGDWDRFIKRS